MIENRKLDKEKNFISIVVYLKNVEEKIEKFTKELDSFFKDKFLAYEFIFVNDNSQDKTKEKLKNISETLVGNVVVVNLAYEHGIEIAMLAGVDLAIGDFVFEFDSVEINYNLEEIMKIYEKSMEGYDIVSASPSDKLKVSSKIFYNVLNTISYKHMNLTTEVFRIISRRAINRILRNKEKFRYRKALYHYSGFNTFVYKYVPIANTVIENRMKWQEKINFGVEILINFSDLGTKLAIKISLLFLIFTILGLCYTIYSYITLSRIQAGWTTMMLFLSVSFSGVFFILAILAKYITVIMNEVKERQNYTYKNVDRLSKK